MTAQYRVKREQTVIIPGLENALAQGIDWANTIGFVTIEARVLDCIAKEQPGRWCDRQHDCDRRSSRGLDAASRQKGVDGTGGNGGACRVALPRGWPEERHRNH